MVSPVISVFYLPGNPLYASGSADTQRNDTGQTGTEYTNRSTVYHFDAVVMPASVELTGLCEIHIDQQQGVWYADFDGVGTAANPIRAMSALVDIGALDGSNKSVVRASRGWKAVESDTAQAGASTTLTLATTASSVDDFYNKAAVSIVGGTGVGQVRKIVGYAGLTRVATVGAWVVNPDNTSVYEILGRIE